MLELKYDLRIICVWRMMYFLLFDYCLVYGEMLNNFYRFCDGKYRVFFML